MSDTEPETNSNNDHEDKFMAFTTAIEVVKVKAISKDEKEFDEPNLQKMDEKDGTRKPMRSFTKILRSMTSFIGWP